MSIKTFLSGYRSLIFWLIWGVVMSWMFGVIMKDFRTSSAIFMGLAIYLGLIIQFVKSRWIKIVASCLGAVAFLFIVRKPLVCLYQMTTNQKISRQLLV